MRPTTRCASRSTCRISRAASCRWRARWAASACSCCRSPIWAPSRVIVAIAIGILFLGGINGKYFSSLLGVLMGTFPLLIWASPWRRARLFAYLIPGIRTNACGSALSAVAFRRSRWGAARWFGVGLGGQRRKTVLPAGGAHQPPDGGGRRRAGLRRRRGCGISLFAIIVLRGFDIGRQAIAMERTFAGMLAQGVAIWFGVQAFINMGALPGLPPTKGLTLPLMSSGGSGVVDESGRPGHAGYASISKTAR